MKAVLLDVLPTRKVLARAGDLVNASVGSTKEKLKQEDIHL